MRRGLAVVTLAAMAAATALALVAPPPALAAMTAAALALMRRRRTYLAFLAIAIPLNVAVLAIVQRDGGWLVGLEGGLRLGAALGGNLALLARAGPARLLEGLRLPPRATALLAAILLAAHDVGRDFARLRDARRLEGRWPRGVLARAREGARLVPPLVVAAHRRALTRREALGLADLRFPAWFVPVVSVAALCAAGRLAFLALPNVALTYVVAFLGGALYGGRVGAAGAFLGMALTDFLLTGLYPGGFVNAPAMALLGLVGGATRRVRVDAALAATIGILSTFLFSVAADSLTWLLLYRGTTAAWLPIVLAGMAFNVVPALVNGALFAATTAPTLRAFRAWQARAPRPTPEEAAPPASDAPPRPAG